MKRPVPLDPHSALKEARGDLYLVGMVFVFLGALFGTTALFAISRSRSWQVQALAAADAVLLIGPGVWYVIASVQLRKKQFGLIRPSMVIAIVQIVLVLLTLLLGMTLRSFLAIVIAPAVVSLFFIPAVIATLFHVRRVEHAMHLLAADGHAFEAIMKVEAIETNDSPPEASDSGHP